MDEWIQYPAFKEDFKKSGMSDDQLADELGVSIFTVRNWIHKSKVPGQATKIRIAKALGVDPHRYVDMPMPGTTLSEVGRFQIEQVRTVLEDPRFSDADRQELVDEMKSKAKWMLSIKGKSPESE